MNSPSPAQERTPPGTPKERKPRKRKSKRENEQNREEVGGANGNVDGQVAIKPNVTFGEDFIAFGPADESEVEPEPVERRKDKGKGRETTPPPRDSRREWDRGKSRVDECGGKRKYEMIFDLDDGHTDKKQRVDANSRKAPWLDVFDWGKCKNVAELLHREVEAFTNWISPTPVEDEIRGLIVARITRAVTEHFPDAQVFPFGSYETKLYLPLGDIDLVILSQSMAYSDRHTVLYALANTLKRAGITPKVTVIARAKVPIVKFVTTHGRINVDISVNQQNGIISGSIINGFLKDMQAGDSLALRSLVLITKAFLSQRSMNEVYTGGLGSYSIVCMAISFLQMHPKIRRGEIDPDKNLGVLIMDFFELYGCYFNYEETGISVRNGGYYFQKKQRGWIDYQKGGLISIEDPADPTNDISKGSFGFQRVRMALAGAHGILTSTTYLRAGVLNSRRHSQAIHLRHQFEAQDMSILSSVMGVTQETINHRKLVQEVYDKKVLHSLIGKPFTVQTNSGANVTVNGTQSSSSTSARGAVHAAWKENDEDNSSDFRPAAYDEEEDGRYHIGRERPPPHKRRRTGKSTDTHTVFITDDEGEDSLSSAAHTEDEIDELGDDDELPDDDHRPGDRRRIQQTSMPGRRRSYWLAKGAGIPEAEEDKGW